MVTTATGGKLFNVMADDGTATTIDAAGEHAPAVAVMLTLRPSSGQDAPALVQVRVTLLPAGTAV